MGCDHAFLLLRVIITLINPSVPTISYESVVLVTAGLIKTRFFLNHLISEELDVETVMVLAFVTMFISGPWVA